jgi:hypothetical protein
VANKVIQEYRARGLSDFEVAIDDDRGDEFLWYFSTDQERKGLPPVERGRH